MNTTLTPTDVEPLTAYDRCDRCGAQARLRVVLPSGSDLIFCGHHAREYETKLRDIGRIVVDETPSMS